MAAAAYKSANGAAGSGTTPSGTMGAAVAGDTKVIVVFAKSASTSITLSSIPSGYTQRQAWTHWLDGESYYAVYSKAVTATESSETLSVTLSSSCPWGFLCVVSVGNWDAISLESGSRIGFGTAATAPSVTTTVNNCVVYNALIAIDWRNFAPPAGTTETVDIRNATLDLSLASGYSSAATAGATGTFAWQFRDPDNPGTALGAVGRAVTFSIQASGVVLSNPGVNNITSSSVRPKVTLTY